MRRREFITMLVGAATWPVPAHGQQAVVPVIGFLNTRSSQDAAHLVTAFRRGLSENGFVDGQNLTIEFRWAGGQYERLLALAAELVGRTVKVIAATGGDPAALAAKAATSTIPIVFSSSDPVKLGLVASYNRPGGNATGINLLTTTMEPKRLGILHDLMPRASTIAALVDPRFPTAEIQSRDIEVAAHAIGIQTEVFRASTDSEIDAAFQSIAQRRLPALLVVGSPFFETRRGNLIALAAQHRLPAIYQFREYAVDGGLMSYGVSITDAYRQICVYAGHILKGAKPADLPVLEPIKFEFLINLKTAKALGVKISDNLLSLADEVIE
jgi:putative tryptophan/tyrosine transport system substrate-binding protein